jgi:spore maturation protein CgeB
MRWFEGMSTGTALLTNTDVEGWKDLGFVDGEHFIGYHGMDDMVEKARWALAHPMEREEIAAAGHKLVREQHTYAHRIIHMLNTCGVSISQETNHGT